MALSNSALAQEETSVLPHGVFRAWVIGAAGGTQFKFNPQGKRENLAFKLNRSVTMTDLESALTKSPSMTVSKTGDDLSLLRKELNHYGAETGQDAKLGDNLFQSDIYADAQVEISQLVMALEYGLTPKLSLGLAMPLMWYDINAKINVKNQDTFAYARSVVKGTELVQKIQEFSQRAPDLATYKKNIFSDYGYHVPGPNRVFGVSDLEGGLKYRAFESRFIDSALLVGFRLPTGTHKKDPRNLVDQNIGDGQLDLAFQASVDFKITPRLIFLSAVKYTFQTADRENIVAPLKGSTDLLPNLNDPAVRDYADRKLGNMWDLNLNLRYYMFQNRFAVVGAYLYQQKYQDRYSGTSNVLDYGSLERNTESQNHSAEVYLIYSTVADYMRKQKAIPWEVSVTYHHTFAGVNSLDTRYAYTRLKFFFN